MAISDRRSQPREMPNTQVIPYQRAVPCPPSPDTSLPEQPTTEIRGSGLFGLGGDRQDLAHEQRLRELYHLGREAAFAEEMGIGLELRVLKTVGEGMSKAEQIVCAYPADNVTGMLLADMASEMAARIHVRHGRVMDGFDAEATNILRRGR